MQTMREFLGAWLVVGALGLAVVGVWGFESTSATLDQVAACDAGVTHDRVADLQGAEVPRTGWRPSPELIGLPQADDDRPTSYEVAEERNINALGPVGHPDAVLAQGSSTSLNPTSMC